MPPDMTSTLLALIFCATAYTRCTCCVALMTTVHSPTALHGMTTAAVPFMFMSAFKLATRSRYAVPL